jgi:hypothetical protein
VLDRLNRKMEMQRKNTNEFEDKSIKISYLDNGHKGN